MEFKQYSVLSTELLYDSFLLATDNRQEFITSCHILCSLQKTSIGRFVNNSWPIISNKLVSYCFSQYTEKSRAVEKTSIKPLPILNYKMSHEANILLKVSGKVSKILNSKVIEPEHIYLAITLDTAYSTYAGKILIEEGINFKNLKNKIIEYIFGSKFTNVYFKNNLAQTVVSKRLYKKKRIIAPKKIINTILKKYTINITDGAKKKKIDYIVGREKEINRLIIILLRKIKSNCLLIGEPGVGKTAIIKGFALYIKNKRVPREILGLEILQLDMITLRSGTKYRGEFEERLLRILDELKKLKNCILVIDNIHKIVRSIGGASSDGSLDIGNILKPQLARGQLRCIGTTTNENYRKIIQKDSALDRRFQPLIIVEPTIDESIKILYSISLLLGKYYTIHIPDLVISASVHLAQQYINDRFLPDKAIDLLDETCAYVESKAVIIPKISTKIKIELDKISVYKETSVRKQEFEKAANYRKFEIEILRQLADRRTHKQILNKKKRTLLQINESDISDVISSWTGIPISKVSQDETESLLQLENILHNRVIGQDIAVSAIANAIRRTRIGLKNLNRPIASFLFAGPTGVGKTELVKAVTSFFFKANDAMIRLDMSEYMERHAISKLIGSPPGYVGFGEGGILTEKVRNKPHSVVLFDEIEKAHPDIYNLLLQILDDGRLTDSQNNLINFKNTIIILTSNIGSVAIQNEIEKQSFNNQILNDKEQYTKIFIAVQNELKKYFRPEFLNRLDEIIVFKPLTQKDIRKITDNLLNELINRIYECYKVKIIIQENVKDKLSAEGFDPIYGARPLRRAITNLLENRLSNLFLENVYKKETVLNVFLDIEKNIEIFRLKIPKIEEKMKNKEVIFNNTSYT